ncbi:MAG TPA: YbhB/YbcL family Raf kinase inhibitor-like protein [Polyangia bacterium]|nr:YbhB/YbcL family Raf kinase inhibitor-like protein [Polyangia bacterium]
MAMTLTSPSFKSGGEIPRRHTCQGQDASPALAWADVPSGARSLALVVDDPDAPDPAAPKTTWVHWVVYDIPANATGLPEGAGAGSLPSGARVAKNDFGHAAWGGPCPPVGRHRYFFKLYALDITLPKEGAATKAALEKAMRGHVLAEAQLQGTYEKGR